MSLCDLPGSNVSFRKYVCAEADPPPPPTMTCARSPVDGRRHNLYVGLRQVVII